MDRLRITGLDFHDVAALSGAGQVKSDRNISLGTSLLSQFFFTSNMEVFSGRKEQKKCLKNWTQECFCLHNWPIALVSLILQFGWILALKCIVRSWKIK